MVINELALLIEGGGDEPDLHEHGWGSEKEVAKSGPWKLDPIKNYVYKTHPRKEEAIKLYQDWAIRVIRCVSSNTEWFIFIVPGRGTCPM